MRVAFKRQYLLYNAQLVGQSSQSLAARTRSPPIKPSCFRSQALPSRPFSSRSDEDRSSGIRPIEKKSSNDNLRVIRQSEESGFNGEKKESSSYFRPTSWSVFVDKPQDFVSFYYHHSLYAIFAK
jgi:hypothetical protein